MRICLIMLSIVLFFTACQRRIPPEYEYPTGWLTEEYPLVRARSLSGRVLDPSGAPMQSGLRDALSLLASALGARPRPEQGLLIAKEFYVALGGHSETATDAETDLIRRIGRRRIVRLPSIAYSAL